MIKITSRTGVLFFTRCCVFAHGGCKVLDIIVYRFTVFIKDPMLTYPLTPLKSEPAKSETRSPKLITSSPPTRRLNHRGTTQCPKSHVKYSLTV